MRYPAAFFKAKVETLRLLLCVENLKHAHGACPRAHVAFFLQENFAEFVKS
jgi:hypothetical protein